MASQEGEERTYQPKDAVGSGLYATLITGGAGLTVSAVQTTLTRQNVGGWAVFTRTGGVITLFGTAFALAHSMTLPDNFTAAMGATYGFSKSAAANLREKDDSWNPAIAGFLAGSIGGLRCRMLGSCGAESWLTYPQ